MKPLALCLAGILAATACQALDLTPRFVTRVTNAGSLRIPYFVDGAARYTVYLPLNVTFHEDGGATTFLFDQLEGASLTMKTSPFSPALPFSATEGYYKESMQAIIQGAREITPREEPAVLLSLPQSESMGFVYTYKLPGRCFMQAVSFVNFNNRQQIMLVLTAPADCFEKAVSLSSKILRSWRIVGEEEDLAAIPTM